MLRYLKSYYKKAALTVTIILCSGFSATIAWAAYFNDSAFIQPVSVKYFPDKSIAGSSFKKVLVDYNNVIYILTDSGVCWLSNGKIVKDLRYRVLSNQKAIDITLQEHTNYLYYLYKNTVLTNGYNGSFYMEIPEGRFDKFAVAANGSILLSGQNNLSLISGKRLLQLTDIDDSVISVKAHQNIFYVLCKHTLYKISGEKLVTLYNGDRFTSFDFLRQQIFIGTREGYLAIDKNSGEVSMPRQINLPAISMQALHIVDGVFWGGTSNGAFSTTDFHKYKYYASMRWINEDSVLDITADDKGNIYLMTQNAVNKIKMLRQTYFQKAMYFENGIRNRHIRYGLLAETRMQKPGDISTAQMIDSDNDGLWTSFYLGAEAFRYAATKDSTARSNAWESFGAYERLLSINPLIGFPARSFARNGSRVADSKAWHISQDSVWQWKGTTSSDEFVGHIFAAAVMDEFVAKNNKEKQRVAGFVDKILTHILAHNYSFVDIDGKYTVWGRWNPEYINGYAKTISDRKLGSTDIIAGLELGYALTGREVYKKTAMSLLYKYGYLDNILISPYSIKATPGYMYDGHDMGSGPWNHSDDEMEFLTYWVLYHYAFNSTLKEKYADAIKAYQRIEAPEKNPAWNLISFGTCGKIDSAATLWSLREFPMDQIRWTIDNSKRKDLTFLEPNFRNQYTSEVLSPAEQPVHRYNTNSFVLKGGEGGITELTGAEYLLPYWMAKYFKLL